MSDALPHLAALGICRRDDTGYCIRSALLALYIGLASQESDDTVWLDGDTGELYLGQTPLTSLTPLEQDLLRFLVEHPIVLHTKTDLILNAWPDDPYPLERSDDSVYQVIRGLRAKIEPDPSKPRYIITWRGAGGREGGYRFHPAGR
jgi:DNA-binding response OmpR family regulator